MCGIVGYTGGKQALPILIKGLSALEYRGYDSAGVSVYEDKIVTIKAEGKLKNLETKLKAGEKLRGTIGIGHTRWATHGEPSETNAHPHLSKNLSLVHNGIVENHVELEEMLRKKGYSFRSATDTEAAAHLIDLYFCETHNPREALFKAVRHLKGSFSFCVMFKCDRETVYAVRKGSPLICAQSAEGGYVASDITAVLPYVKNYYALPEGVVAEIKPQSIKFFSSPNNEISCEKKKIEWDAQSAQKCGYNHYMLKEINEQPEAIKNTVMPRLRDGIPVFDCDMLDRVGTEITDIKIVACGTAMHAGLLGKTLIERFARVPVSVEIASEFRYSNPIINKNTLMIFISQSGETADTIAALNLSREMGAKTLAIVNVVGSSVARLADYVIYTWAGPEIAVASTKAFTVQCAVMYQIAFKLALARRQISEGRCRELCKSLSEEVPGVVSAVLSMSGRIKRVAEKLSLYENMFFIGRGVDNEICKEASLKLKEVSYIHSESYPAGELKHGTISLVDDNVPIVALFTESDLLEKTMNNVREAKSRGATVFSVCTKECEASAENVSDYLITLPAVSVPFAPLLAGVAFQLLAY
ncbi:MAG: glutamine--fructose-6-phosphate transaminase (isomerizing), partial [Clostridia bacterium]|nr:glutamine--fructose-6-phosphate transaminase (isomerizing) [Clostridia bacterium]